MNYGLWTDNDCQQMMAWQSERQPNRRVSDQLCASVFDAIGPKQMSNNRNLDGQVFCTGSKTNCFYLTIF